MGQVVRLPGFGGARRMPNTPLSSTVFNVEIVGIESLGASGLILTAKMASHTAHIFLSDRYLPHSREFHLRCGQRYLLTCRPRNPSSNYPAVWGVSKEIQLISDINLSGLPTNLSYG